LRYTIRTAPLVAAQALNSCEWTMRPEGVGRLDNDPEGRADYQPLYAKHVEEVFYARLPTAASTPFYGH
jgi:hypothetical protein